MAHRQAIQHRLPPIEPQTLLAQAAFSRMLNHPDLESTTSAYYQILFQHHFRDEFAAICEASPGQGGSRGQGDSRGQGGSRVDIMVLAYDPQAIHFLVPAAVVELKHCVESDVDRPNAYQRAALVQTVQYGIDSLAEYGLTYILTMTAAGPLVKLGIVNQRTRDKPETFFQNYDRWFFITAEADLLLPFFEAIKSPDVLSEKRLAPRFEVYIQHERRHRQHWYFFIDEGKYEVETGREEWRPTGANHFLHRSKRYWAVSWPWE